MRVKKNFLKHRTLFQTLFFLVSNGYFLAFFKKQIYTGKAKYICLPGLNCYSCPSSFGACPIGSLQNSLAQISFSFPFYLLGLLLFFALLFGRVVCGFLCPFGLIQDLLYKIKTPKLKIAKKVDSKLRFVKYAILFSAVIMLPIIFADAYGNATPIFCKYICPSGTLFAALPLLALQSSLFNSIGFIFFIKIALALTVVVFAIFLFRPFCKYLCPLGAFYGLFNPISLFSQTIDKKKCTSCGKCESACPMQIEVTKRPNSFECIRCGKCKIACSSGAIQNSLLYKNQK